MRAVVVSRRFPSFKPTVPLNVNWHRRIDRGCLPTTVWDLPFIPQLIGLRFNSSLPKTFVSTKNSTSTRLPHSLLGLVGAGVAAVLYGWSCVAHTIDDPETSILGPVYSHYAFEDPNEFQEWTLFGREPVCADAAIFTFVRREKNNSSRYSEESSDLTTKLLKDIIWSGLESPSPNVLGKVTTERVLQALYDSAIWNVEIKQPQLNVAREYTPLPPIIPHEQVLESAQLEPLCSPEETTTTVQLRLLIRDYGSSGGEVSRFVHQMPVGSRIEIRGPRIEALLPWNNDHSCPVLFLSAGTGIVPAIQLASAVWRRSYKLSRNGEQSSSIPLPPFKIFWSTRSSAECSAGMFPGTQGNSSLWEVLSSFISGKDTRQVGAQAYPSNPLTSIIKQLQSVYPLLSINVFPASGLNSERSTVFRRLCKKDVVSHLDNSMSSRQIVLLCGPRQYVSYFMGSLFPTCSIQRPYNSQQPGKLLQVPTGRISGVPSMSLPVYPTTDMLKQIKKFDHLGRELPTRFKRAILLDCPDGRVGDKGCFVGCLESA